MLHALHRDHRHRGHAKHAPAFTHAAPLLLPQVAETGGDMGRYWELWRTGRWWWHVHADSLEYGGDRHDVCSLPSSSM